MRKTAAVLEPIRTLVCFAAVLIILAALACLVMQFRPAAVTSGSMEPEVPVGSLVIIDTKVRSVEAVDIGDIIAFRVSGTKVTHRVEGFDEAGLIHTKGDAMEERDPWTVGDSQLMGKVIFCIPLAGKMIMKLCTVPGIIILAASLGLLVVTSGWAEGLEASGPAEDKHGTNPAEERQVAGD